MTSCNTTKSSTLLSAVLVSLTCDQQRAGATPMTVLRMTICYTYDGIENDHRLVLKISRYEYISIHE